MRAFVFDFAELLSMDNETLDLLIKLLNPELILKLYNIIYSNEFQGYKDNEYFKNSIEVLENKLERFLKPTVFMEEIKVKKFPDYNMSYFEVFTSDFNLIPDILRLFDMEIKKLVEIYGVVNEFLDVINYWEC